MKIGGKINIWPGYVASIASLLLSILLLIGVLTIAMSQVDALVTNKMDVITKMVEDEKVVVNKSEKKTVVVEPAIVKPQQQIEPKIVEVKKENKIVKKVIESMRIVVEDGVFSLEGNQVNELSKNIKEINRQSGVTWQLFACRINNSSTSTQDSFNLMFQVRDLLKKNGVNLENITTQINDCTNVKGIRQGEILLELIPNYQGR